MEDRIQINGIWYVREDAPKEDYEECEPLDLIECQTLTYEDDELCLEAIKLIHDEVPYALDIDIQYTDKLAPKPWKEELWDSNSWMKAVLDDEPEAIKSALESMKKSQLRTFKKFLTALRERGWL